MKKCLQVRIKGKKKTAPWISGESQLSEDLQECVSDRKLPVQVPSVIQRPEIKGLPPSSQHQNRYR